MITENYCSYEISRLLKEKGFHAPDLHGLDSPQGHLWVKVTHQMAMKWLREVHGLFTQIGYYEDWADDADGKKVDSWNYWGIDIFYLPSGLRVDPELTDQFDTYEEAVEAAIKYCLTELI